jgi:hypothetical protein
MRKDVEVVLSGQHQGERVGKKIERIVQDKVDSLITGFLMSSLLACCSAIQEENILHYLCPFSVSF